MADGSAPARSLRVEFDGDLRKLESAVDAADSKLKGFSARASNDLGKVEAKAEGAAEAIDGLAQATTRGAAADDRARDTKGRFVSMTERLGAQLQAATGNLGACSTATERAAAAAQRAVVANDNLAGSVHGVSRALGVSLPLFDRFGGLAGKIGPTAVAVTAVSAAVIAAGVAIAMAGDKYVTYENQLKAAGVATGSARDVTRELAAMAVSTRVPVEGLVNLYARLTRVSSDLGISQADVKRGTEILSKTLATSGLSAGEATAGVLQLSQALQSGRLNGDELRSVLENMPEVAKAIAREFKTTVGGLRQLGEEGVLTSDRVFSAILKAGPEVEAAFAKTAPTISTATTAMTTAFQHLGAEVDRLLNLSPTIAAVVMKVANVVESAAQGVGNYEPSMRARQIEALQAEQRRLEEILASISGSGDTVRMDNIRAQIAGVAESIDLLTRSSAKYVDNKINEAVGEAAPPLRFMSDELARLTNETSSASGQLPGLAGALNGVAGAAANAANQVASVAAGIRAIQGLNPDLAGVLSFVDKAKTINDKFEATRGRIAADFMETGNGEAAIKGYTEAIKAQQDALKALNAERNKPVQDYVRQGELSQLSDRDRALAQNADSYAKLAEQRRKETEYFAGIAKTPEEAAQIRAQGAEVIAQIDNARKLLDAKTKADASAKAARQSARDSAPDGFDTAFRRSEDSIEELKQQAESAGKATAQIYALTEANRLRRAALSAGRTIDADLASDIDRQADAYGRQRKATEDALEGQRRLQEGVRALGQEFGSFVDDIVMGGRSMSDAFGSLAKSLGSSGLQALLTGQGPMAGLLGTAPTEKGQMGGLLGGLGNLDFSKFEKAISEGSFEGVYTSLTDWVKPATGVAEGAAGAASGGFASSKLGGGLMAAGIGASVGYSSGSPIAGALSGGLAGLMTGNPIMGLVGAGAGLLGGSSGHQQLKKKDREDERRQRVREFEACGDADGCVAVPA